MAVVSQKIEDLQRLLQACGPVAVAVSGGVDSMTLATVAGRSLRHLASMYHAVSPAVPPEATRRVEALAASEHWSLQVFDAGEFQRDEYLSNPVNRCFYCKESLYSAIRKQAGSSVQLLSGTNVDDLAEYRPGLEAASRAAVRHPFVEAGIRKEDVRAIAAGLGLGEISQLPSSPCLASRVETGIPVTPQLLTLVHAAESALRELLQVAIVRCRFRATGIVVELDERDRARLSPAQTIEVETLTHSIFVATPFAAPVAIRSYRRGSAFLVRVNAQ